MIIFAIIMYPLTEIETQVTVGIVDNRLYNEILAEYVHSGLVNYRALRKDRRLGEYIQLLAGTDPSELESDAHRLAFWINVYNAYTLKIICDHYPVESINDLHTSGFVLGHMLKTTLWDRKLVLINGETITLNHIEHEIIRRKFKEPRAHFALVCASKGCPSLRAEAYEAKPPDEQLDDQARTFLNDSAKNWFDGDKKEAHISKIFNWFSEDFGKDDTSILLFISKFLPDNIANAIRKDPNEWNIDYTDYDWSLNEE